MLNNGRVRNLPAVEEWQPGALDEFRPGDRGSWLHRGIRKAEESASRFSRYVARHPVVALSFLSVFYVAVTGSIALATPFWYDELFTVYISRLAKISDIQAILASGLDQLPLPYFLLVRLSRSLPFPEELTMRLPSLVGFWIGCLALYKIVERRSSTVWGLLAVFIPLCSSFCYRYASEARPYGLMFGFAALAFLCWQAEDEPRHRRMAILGLSCSLLAATCSHYYAILVVLPLAAGELARLVSGRSSFAAWAAFLPSLAPFPFAHVNKNLGMYGANFWSKPNLRFFPNFYERMFEPLLLPCLGLVLLIGFFLLVERRERRQKGAVVAFPPQPEVIAAIGFATLPAAAYLLAILVTHALVPRYALPAIIGFSVLCPLLACRASRASGLLGWAALAMMVAGFGIHLALIARNVLDFRQEVTGVGLPAAALQSDLPVVIENPLFFFERSHYLPQTSRNWFYLVDPPTARRYPNTYLDPGVILLTKIAPVNVQTLATFLAKHSRFFLLKEEDPRYDTGWILNRLIDLGADVRLRTVQGGHRIFAVTARDAQDSTATF